jgi:hypothetical protein
MTAFALDLRCQPAEDILRLILPDANVQPVPERLDIFYIPILARYMTEKTDRRAAQFKDAPIQPRPQVGRCILCDDFSIFHEPHAVTT